MNEEVGVGACGKPTLWFSKQRWTGSHGCGSVHPVVELREGVRDLHHLTGHYRRPPYPGPSVRRNQFHAMAPSSASQSARLVRLGQLGQEAPNDVPMLVVRSRG
jgi:hypothetical protein